MVIFKIKSVKLPRLYSLKNHNSFVRLCQRAIIREYKLPCPAHQRNEPSFRLQQALRLWIRVFLSQDL